MRLFRILRIIIRRFMLLIIVTGREAYQSLPRRINVQDVIFINNISMTRNAYLVGKIAQIK